MSLKVFFIGCWKKLLEYLTVLCFLKYLMKCYCGTVFRECYKNDFCIKSRIWNVVEVNIWSWNDLLKYDTIFIVSSIWSMHHKLPLSFWFKLKRIYRIGKTIGSPPLFNKIFLWPYWPYFFNWVFKNASPNKCIFFHVFYFFSCLSLSLYFVPICFWGSSVQNEEVWSCCIYFGQRILKSSSASVLYLLFYP